MLVFGQQLYLCVHGLLMCNVAARHVVVGNRQLPSCLWASLAFVYPGPALEQHPPPPRHACLANAPVVM